MKPMLRFFLPCLQSLTLAPGLALAPALAPVLAPALAPVLALELALALALAPVDASAQTAAQQAGRSKAQSCAVCHGPVGISSQPDTPHLAGQPAIYLAAQLRAYRSGTRKHEVMSVMAKPLTDDEISQLADWFSTIRVEATPPY